MQRRRLMKVRSNQAVLIKYETRSCYWIAFFPLNVFTNIFQCTVYQKNATACDRSAVLKQYEPKSNTPQIAVRLFNLNTAPPTCQSVGCSIASLPDLVSLP